MSNPHFSRRRMEAVLPASLARGAGKRGPGTAIPEFLTRRLTRWGANLPRGGPDGSREELTREGT